jgi:hypothetical protein
MDTAPFSGTGTVLKRQTKATTNPGGIKLNRLATSTAVAKSTSSKRARAATGGSEEETVPVKKTARDSDGTSISAEQVRPTLLGNGVRFRCCYASWLTF